MKGRKGGEREKMDLAGVNKSGLMLLNSAVAIHR